MGIDGFSMGNLVQTSEISPVQVAGEAERLAAKESKFEVKTLKDTAKEDDIKRREEEYKEDFEENQNKKRRHGSNNPSESSSTDLSETNFENANLKDFDLNINDTTDEVELINKRENRIMERINANDLMNVLKKVNHSSGIFVNKSV